MQNVIASEIRASRVLLIVRGARRNYPVGLFDSDLVATELIRTVSILTGKVRMVMTPDL